MKRIICLLLSAALLLSLTACGSTPSTSSGSAEPSAPQSSAADSSVATPEIEPTEDAYHFTRDNFPVIDGSTSMVPLGQGIASVLLGESRDDASDLISFNKTTQSFRNLSAGECDLVIAAEPDPAVFDELKEAGFDYEMETIAKEALVFVVNEDNPVDSLTQEQVRGIYDGTITNWSEVGGNDEPIEAFQRNAGAGSQVMMEKLVMGDTPMMEAPETAVVSGMGELLEAVKSYDNSANAIGYTVYYYAADMQMADGLKILSIDGVMPSPDTLRTEEYPYLNGYYCCIPADTASDAPARLMYDWLVSDAGQALLTLEGYVSVTTEGEASATGDNIYTDYTNYTPYGAAAASYTRISDGPLNDLTAGDSYGAIMPYQGTLIYGNYDESDPDMYLYGSTYGFFDTNGELLTDPVYSEVGELYDYYGDPHEEILFWYFAKTVGTGENQTLQYGFASVDGSFVTPTQYASVSLLGNQYICAVKSYDDISFDLYDLGGNIACTQEEMKQDGLTLMPTSYSDGLFCCDAYNENGEYVCGYILNEDLTVFGGPYTTVGECSHDYITVCDEAYNSSLIDTLDANPVTINGETVFSSLYMLCDGYMTGCFLDDETSFVADLDGNIIVGDIDYAASYGGGFSVTSGMETTYYDSEGNMLYGGPLSEEEWTMIYPGLFYTTTAGGMTLKNFDTGEELEIEHGEYAYIPSYYMMDYATPGDINTVYVATGDENGTTGIVVVNADLSAAAYDCADASGVVDHLTGTCYTELLSSYGFSGETRVLDPDSGEVLFKDNGTVDVCGGNYIVTDDWATACYAPDGTLIFCYPFYGSGSGD